MNPVVAAVAAAAGLRISGTTPVGGGSIAQVMRLLTDSGPYCLKLAAADAPFDAEADGLAGLAAAGAIRVPRVVGLGTAAGHSYLLLEWIDLSDDGDWPAAGRALARLHAHTVREHGWHRDNTIGATPQLNTPDADWSRFWRERRLRPQLVLARRNGLAALAALEDAACAASDALLAAHRPRPSLLHGDLWRGNFAFDARGTPTIFDPACYHGDAETDLAMTRLFGGFPPAFYAAYDAERPAAPGARERDLLYRLYHWLNHANLFGGGYVAQAAASIERLAAYSRRF